MIIEGRAPLRIDLAGGWSDIPPFALREGGAVLNVAITEYVRGEVRRERVEEMDNMHISYGLNLPAGSGLGSSAALSVVWLALVHANMGQVPAQEELARKACELGTLLGILGGKQDEYAAALGGVNLMRFTDTVAVEPLDLDPQTSRSLEERLILCYCGQARLSSDIHDRVWGAYERGDAGVGRTLGELRDIAIAMRDALAASDFDGVAALMNQNWDAQKRLHPSITNAAVERLFDTALDAGAVAGKACGAGGGGCIVFLADPEHVLAVRRALQDRGARLIDVRIDRDGAVVSRR